MTPKQWQPLVARFRALLPEVRAFANARDNLPDDYDIFVLAEELLAHFPEGDQDYLSKELVNAINGDGGPVAPLPADKSLEDASWAFYERLEEFAGEAEDLSYSGDDDEDEDEEGDEDEESDEGSDESEDEEGDGGEEDEEVEEEVAAPVSAGETSEGKGQTYRGDIRAIVGVGDTLAFTTVHPEGAPTALYWLDADKLSLKHDALPCGGVALAADGNTVYVGGTDNKLYECGRKAPKPLAGPFAGRIAGIAVLAKKRLAVLHGKQIDIISDKDGELKQTLELPEDGTCLSTDKTESWLVAGTTKGNVAVFDGQDTDEFVPGETAKLHDGAVTLVKFEPEELRFFSAGADNKLYTTFARGTLEPEDKGRGNMHEDVLTALALVPGDRMVTGSRDATLKNWPRGGAIKPGTLKDIVGKVVGLAVVTVYNQPHLACVCDDNTIRFLRLEEDGKFPDEEVVHEKVTGAAEWVRNELGQKHDPKRREKALKVLAEWKDSASIEILGEQLTRDTDPKLREFVADLLVKSDNPRVVKILERAIGHGDGKVRLIAFNGLHARAKDDLGPIDLALKIGHADVGIAAVKALEPLAKADDQALTRLVDALDASTWDVRKTALGALETVYDAKAPTASLTALGSKHGDVRAAGLIRAYERWLLEHPAVQSAIRRRLEDGDAAVRKVAFLLSVLSKEQLAGVLRASDSELNRQLNELEKAEKADKAAPPVAADAKSKLTPTDYDTLLQATASRALDTCLRGARGLAVLGDPRAFGLLLQLSREEDVSARVDVCRALAALDDERAVNRLRSMLFDTQASVRDAAYTALVKIFDKTPLAVAESGLTAADEDVRRRGLETLVKVVKRKPPEAAGEPGWDLLVRALNDGARGVRSEAFKAALNLKIAGGGPDTLRFALQSIHPDVRREALTEVTAQEKEEWAAPLLYEFFNDPDAGLRREAFEFATKKNKDIAVLETALGSKHADARKLAVEALIKKHSKAAQQVLLKALGDADRDVRLLAVNALVDDDAKGPLAQATQSDRGDIRVRAAAALAKHGDAAVYPALTELATVPEPQLKERASDWLDVTALALGGLGELGDPRALPHVVELTNSPHNLLRTAAARALVWVAKLDTTAALRTALQHSDPQVKYRAALGLAYLGDATVGPLVRGDTGGVVTPAEQFTATVALGAAAGVQGTVYLDNADEKLRDRALLATLLLELKDTDGQPDKCIECVSAKGARFRLTGARALEAFADRAAFREFVIKEVNDRGDDTPWKVSPEVIDDLANLLAFAPPQLKAKTALLLRLFDNKEQAEWNAEWGVHAARYAKEIKEAAAVAKSAGVPVPAKLTPEQLRELAFGGYVGLVREQGASGNSAAVAKVRQTALARIFAIASKDATHARSAQPVLAQAMGDPNQPVRTQAFEHLQALGMDRAALGAEALEAGYTDLGVKGLELLTGGASAKKGEAVLERVMLSRSDDLAVEAAKLLRDRQGKVPVAQKALDSVHEPMRLAAVEWLASEYEASDDAKQHLRAAVESRYRKVREKTAFELAGKKDGAAFDALARFLREASDAQRQGALMEALTTLGDPRAAGAMLDRIQNDPGGTAMTGELLSYAADFRIPAIADRMFLMLDRMKDWQEWIFSSILTVSGHDQHIGDSDDERPQDRPSWMKDQHPRHDALLARLLERAFADGETDYVVTALLAPARWSLRSDVNAAFATLCTSPNVDLRDAAVQAYGWRFRKRAAPADPLLKAVKHKNPVTQFYAAEGLARGGRADGMQVLLSGIEYLEDPGHRVRAVQALGELGDPRSVDKLLALATEDGSPLQEAATEAVGHLKKSPQADAVFRLLEKHAKGQSRVAERALVGLRWFDTPTGWDIVRAKLAAKGYGGWIDRLKTVAADQLGYNDDPAARDLLLKTVRTVTNYDVVMTAYASARRLWGKDGLEPNYNLVQNPNAANLINYHNTEPGGELGPVVARGDALRIMELFPNCQPEIQQQLESALLTRPNLPVKEAVASLTHADEGTVRLASRLLGRVSTPDTGVKTAIGGALTKWWATWQERRAKVGKSDALAKAGEVVESLLFTAGRVGVPTESLAGVATSRPDDPLARGIRLEAVRCLALGARTPAVLHTLETLAVGPDADVRVLASEMLARFDAPRASKLATPDKNLSDRPSFNRLVIAGAVRAKDVAGAAANPHVQPVALPVFVAEKDVPTLAAVAKDRKANEAARFGAVEGLGVMATEPAEAVLVEIGTAKDDEKELRKAAWRALRGSKRARKRGAVNTLATMPKVPKAAKPANEAKGGDEGDEGDEE